jgi:hypothetical protein
LSQGEGSTSQVTRLEAKQQCNREHSPPKQKRAFSAHKLKEGLGIEEGERKRKLKDSQDINPLDTDFVADGAFVF